MTSKTWVIFVAAVVVLFGGLVYMSSQNKIDVSDVPAGTVLAASETNGNIGDHVFGNPESKVVLIEYGDFQCPSCAGIFPRLQELKYTYEDQIAFVFRNLPLTSIHPNAKAAAAAAEAASKQGKFWEMHDTLFENQNAWGSLGANERTEQFVAYATEIELDIVAFRSDLDAADIKKKIEFDQALAKKIGASSTPTLVLNGVMVEQDVWASDETLEKAIRDEIQKQGIALPESASEE